MNKHYKAYDRRSGLQDVDNLDYCRRMFFEHQAYATAKRNLSSSKSTYKKEHPDVAATWSTNPKLEENWEDDHLKRKVDAVTRKYGDNWYPDFWLTFLLLGLPCPDKSRRNVNIVNGEMSSVKDSGNILLNEKKGKNNRREQRAYITGLVSVNSSTRESVDLTDDSDIDNRSNKRHMQVIHRFDIPTAPKVQPTRVELMKVVQEGLEKQIHVLESMVKESPDDMQLKTTLNTIRMSYFHALNDSVQFMDGGELLAININFSI